ncbi:MAG: hypothetical protein AB3N23_02420 [Paracoccaceae bacterium]
MEFIADIFLGAGALGAGLYCLVLSRRLNRFGDLEKGVGGAVAVLSSQVDDLTEALSAAQTMSTGSAETLDSLTGRAEAVAGRLELMMAALHDLPDQKQPQAEDTPPPASEPEEEPAEPMFVRHSRLQRHA